LSYNYVLSLVVDAGMRYKAIMTFHECGNHYACMQLGLTDCAGLVKVKSAFEKLETLKLRLIEDQHQPRWTPKERWVDPNAVLSSIKKLTFLYSSLRLCRQISDRIMHMHMLKSLVLDFELEPRNSANAWSVLARAPAVPMSESLQLNRCIIAMSDFSDFLGKHRASWRSLIIGHLHLTNGSMEDVGMIYEMLSQAPKIEKYFQRSLLLGLGEHEHVQFPSGIRYPDTSYNDNEDGFVEVFQTEWICWKGHDEVVEVLDVMARHLLAE
jgi:hypothetical protein